MMNSLISYILVLACVTSLVLANPLQFESEKKCAPDDNCKLPHCRCWDDALSPGNFSVMDRPQIILLTFDYAMNRATVKDYLKIFESLTNPNQCAAKGTFFVQAHNSEADTLAGLYSAGHELAINSDRGIIPTSEAEWEKNFQEVEKLIKKAKVPLDTIKGVRAPELFNGGNDQFAAMSKSGLNYDASCVTVDYSSDKKLLWPYTLDYVGADFPKCSVGHKLNKSFPGIWMFPEPVMTYGKSLCATPSGCIPEINKTDDVIRLFFEAFGNHYYGSKAPFVVDIDARWVTEEYRIQGTKMFLEMVGSYTDTWILTMSQALQWIRDPQPLSKIFDFDPWKC